MALRPMSVALRSAFVTFSRRGLSSQRSKDRLLWLTEFGIALPSCAHRDLRVNVPRRRRCCSFPQNQDMPPAIVDWEKRWVDEDTPWDLSGVTPALRDAVERQSGSLGHALVPGCGAAYDVAFLAGRCATVTAIDVAPGAVEVARQKTESTGADIVLGNFFEHDFGRRFDFIFDYTFFCAIQPCERPRWGKRMAELLGDGGRLLTLVFPIDESKAFDPNAEGPPFPVSVAAYEDVLLRHGLIKVSESRSEHSVKPRRDKELVVWWEKPKQKL